MQNENGKGNELYERLLREAELDPQRESLLQHLAEYPSEDVIPVMLKILQEDADKLTGATAIEVIEIIGYPKNEAAIPTLIAFLSADINDLRNSAAITTLLHIPIDVLVPYLVQVLLGQKESYFGEADFFSDFDWSDVVEGICYTISGNKIDKEYALLCCPAVNYLLSQDNSALGLRLNALLRVIEKVTLEVDYVIPTLIKFVQQHPEDRYKERVWKILLSFKNDTLVPYERMLDEMFQ